MKTRKMVEIIAIVVGGLIATGLSIKAVINADEQKKKADKQEQELKHAQNKLLEKQDRLLTLHDELEKKSVEMILLQQTLQAKSQGIIKLQEELNNDSKIQINNLERLNHPIPLNFTLNVFAKLDLSPNEIDELITALNATQDRSNLLPLDFAITNNTVEKINMFKDIGFSLTIQFESDGKKMEVIYNSPKPMYLMGYNAPAFYGGTCIMALLKEQKQVDFHVNNAISNTVSFNYISPSLLDFKNSNVTISYNFSSPTPYQVGNSVSNIYTNNTTLKLKINQVSLKSNNLTITLNNLQESENGTFLKTYKLMD